jgi:hypothetical protein
MEASSMVAVTEEASGSGARVSSPWKRVKWPRIARSGRSSTQGSRIRLTPASGPRKLLHLAASDEVAEVDGDEARVLEQLDHLRFRVDVVAGEKDHALAPGLVRVLGEDRGAEVDHDLTVPFESLDGLRDADPGHRDDDDAGCRCLGHCPRRCSSTVAID